MIARTFKSRVGKVGLALLILNEVRGVIVVAGVLWGWFHHVP